MKRITLNDLWLVYMNTELDNEIFVFNDEMKAITLSVKRLADIWRDSDLFELDKKLMKSKVQWFAYNSDRNSIDIRLVYEDWMKDYE